MNDHPSPRRMRVTPIGELGCQNETRGGGGSTCAWRTLSTARRCDQGAPPTERRTGQDVTYMTNRQSCVRCFAVVPQRFRAHTSLAGSWLEKSSGVEFYSCHFFIHLLWQ